MMLPSTSDTLPRTFWRQWRTWLDRTDLAAVAGEEGNLRIAYAELVQLLHKKLKTLEARIEQLESLVEKLMKVQRASEDDSPAS